MDNNGYVDISYAGFLVQVKGKILMMNALMIYGIVSSVEKT